MVLQNVRRISTPAYASSPGNRDVFPLGPQANLKIDVVAQPLSRCSPMRSGLIFWRQTSFGVIPNDRSYCARQSPRTVRPSLSLLMRFRKYQACATDIASSSGPPLENPLASLFLKQYDKSKGVRTFLFGHCLQEILQLFPSHRPWLLCISEGWKYTCLSGLPFWK